MISLWIAFITGLTTGGLGCLALQGGLLASSLAQQVEALQPGSTKRTPGIQARPAALSANGIGGRASGRDVARTILLFLGAKVMAHAVLGLILGALGSILKLNALTRALLQFAIGIFMIGNALRMLNVHPVFRFFAFEPPAWITRYIRRTSKREASLALPLFLGVLTILIPCGVTQSMMMTAVGTGDALMGGALMAAFMLGTSPMFFVVAYSAMQIGARLEHLFMRAVAIIVLVLGLVAIDSGLNLMGSPASASRLARALRDERSTPQVADLPAQGPGVHDGIGPTRGEEAALPNADAATPDNDANAPEERATMTAKPEVQTLYVMAQHEGYVPPKQRARANTPTTVVFVTELARSCTRALVIPALKFETYLPETGKVTVDLPPMAPGTVLRYSCAAGIYTGEIIFD